MESTAPAETFVRVAIITEPFEKNGPDHAFYHAMRYYLRDLNEFPDDIEHLRKDMSPAEVADMVSKSEFVVVLLTELPMGPGCAAALDAAKEYGVPYILVPTIYINHMLGQGYEHAAERLGCEVAASDFGGIDAAAWEIYKMICERAALLAKSP